MSLIRLLTERFHPSLNCQRTGTRTNLRRTWGVLSDALQAFGQHSTHTFCACCAPRPRLRRGKIALGGSMFGTSGGTVPCHPRQGGQVRIARPGLNEKRDRGNRRNPFLTGPPQYFTTCHLRRPWPRLASYMPLLVHRIRRPRGVVSDICLFMTGIPYDRHPILLFLLCADSRGH